MLYSCRENNRILLCKTLYALQIWSAGRLVPEWRVRLGEQYLKWGYTVSPNTGLVYRRFKLKTSLGWHNLWGFQLKIMSWGNRNRLSSLWVRGYPTTPGCSSKAVTVKSMWQLSVCWNVTQVLLHHVYERKVRIQCITYIWQYIIRLGYTTCMWPYSTKHG
jgi:hypothetical protein